jgi:hypothetical protein
MFPKTAEKASGCLSKNGSPVLKVNGYKEARKNVSSLAVSHEWNGQQRHVLE